MAIYPHGSGNMFSRIDTTITVAPAMPNTLSFLNSKAKTMANANKAAQMPNYRNNSNRSSNSNYSLHGTKAEAT